ncbi:MAG: GAF domain-containing protein [Chthonomonadetes bacterium]|nr:GAF domain-containing protein [Chthonomonadetes bacterium]
MSKQQHYRQTLRQLGRLVQQAVSQTDIDQFLTTALEEGMKLVGGFRAFVALVDEDAGELVIHSALGPGWDEEKRQRRLQVAQEEGKGITGYVAATQRPYCTGDVRHDPHYLRFFEDVVSEMAVPIVDAYGRTRGVINIESDQPNAYDEEDVEAIVLVADLCLTALSLHQSRLRQEALVQIGNELSTSEDRDDLMQTVLDVASKVLRFEDCSVFLVDDDRKRLTLVASSGTLREQVGRVSYPLGEGLTGWVAQHGEPLRTANPREDPRWRGIASEMPVEQIGAFLAVPIWGRDRTIGVIRVVRRRSIAPWFDNCFTDDEVEVLSAIGSQLGSALESLNMRQRLVQTERMAAWGEMSAKAAHMIGNRTFAIKGDLNEVEYLLQQPEINREELTELIGSIRRGVSRLEEILHEFRDFVMATHLSTGVDNVNNIITQTVAEMFPRRGPVELRLDLHPQLPDIRCDAVKLKRCFAEMIENSLSFQPEGGELHIRTELVDSRALPERFGVGRNRQFVHVVFCDKGPGVPEDIKEKIFQPFFSSRVKGMGLGLSIVKGIVEAHRGFVYEDGKPGEGACFHILLPVNGKPASEDAETKERQ